jgi:hypothetical protein
VKQPESNQPEQNKQQGHKVQKPLNELDKTKAKLVIVAGFLVLAYLFDSEILVLIATVLGVGFVFIKPFGELVLYGWFGLAKGLGWFNSRVLLSLIYFLFLTPLAIAFRLFGNDPLRLRKVPSDSMYVKRKHTYQRGDLENPW